MAHVDQEGNEVDRHQIHVRRRLNHVRMAPIDVNPAQIDLNPAQIDVDRRLFDVKIWQKHLLERQNDLVSPPEYDDLMKALHLRDFFGWSSFDEARNLDFNSVAWIRAGGNILFDPLPLTPHDEQHLASLGGASLIVVTNAEHLRGAPSIAARFGATIIGPSAERDRGLPYDGFVSDGEIIVPGLRVFTMDGSKTPGELALLIEDTTLITGDLIRAHQAGYLTLLPDARLVDRTRAVASVRRLASLPGIEAVLVGDGWPIFRHGGEALRELADRLG